MRAVQPIKTTDNIIISTSNDITVIQWLISRNIPE